VQLGECAIRLGSDWSCWKRIGEEEGIGREGGKWWRRAMEVWVVQCGGEGAAALTGGGSGGLS
jgi:hypothetical protein